MQQPSGMVENINIFWAQLAISVCVHNGVTCFVISPGSRSTPLTVAAARHPKVTLRRAYDERGAAYWALGWARATGKPAVLIATSGTAVANYLPAVVEASQEGIPLLLFTADRPPELRDTAANQTIQQPGIFGTYVRWQFDMPTPSVAIDPRMVLTTVEQAIFRSQTPYPGPVHINWMFREPLAPLATETLPETLQQFWQWWQQQRKPFTEYRAGVHPPTKDDIRQVKHYLLNSRNGLLVLGGLHRAEDRQAAWRLAHYLRWPVYGDVRSGIPVHQITAGWRYLDITLAHPQWQRHYRPDVILHLGTPVTSKRYLQWTATLRESLYIHVSPLPHRQDPNHQVRLRLYCDLAEFVNALTFTEMPLHQPPVLSLLPRLQSFIDAIIEKNIADNHLHNEIGVIRQLAVWIPEGWPVFLGNSLPIRLWDWFAIPAGEVRAIFANRGASGIDGLIATASGIAAGVQQPLTAIIGDIATIHDLNSLIHLKESSIPMVLIILNNAEGGIFRWLPIAGVLDVFEQHFLTPHTFNFRKIAEMFGIPYGAPRTLKGFQKIYRQWVRQPDNRIIEIRTRSAETYRSYEKILEAVRHALEPPHHK